MRNDIHTLHDIQPSSPKNAVNKTSSKFEAKFRIPIGSRFMNPNLKQCLNMDEKEEMKMNSKNGIHLEQLSASTLHCLDFELW